MKITITPNVTGDHLEGVTFDVTHTYEADGIRVRWEISDLSKSRDFTYRILNRHMDTSVAPTPEELTTEGEVLVPNTLTLFQYKVECYDAANITEPLAFIIIEDLAETDEPPSGLFQATNI